MGFHVTSLSVPAVVRRIADSRAVRPVWVNELGGMTFRVDGKDGFEFVKLWPLDLAGEARRLRWAARYVPVPRVSPPNATCHPAL